MKRIFTTSVITIAILLNSHAVNAEKATIKPEVMSQKDIAGDIFIRPDMMIEKRDNGTQALDVTSMLSSDKKFITGMYQAPAGRLEINDPYGVDEYMYFLKGGVTLTSSDGSITEIKAGDAVTISKEWTGIWDTQGYTKMYVIYSPDKPLE
jgi:uncharacterized cupin superfamily protein